MNPARVGDSSDRFRSRFAGWDTFHGDLEFVDFFSQRVAVHTQPFSRLNLIPIRFAQDPKEQRSLDGLHHGRMEIVSRASPHGANEISDLRIEKIIQLSGGCGRRLREAIRARDP